MNDPNALYLPLDRVAEGLADLYAFDPLRVARVCDEIIDPSGTLLGRVRKIARRPVGESPGS